MRNGVSGVLGIKGESGSVVTERKDRVPGCLSQELASGVFENVVAAERQGDGLASEAIGDINMANSFEIGG